jgi:xanthine/CO dehydrogenase XdhC/CoxF family maturation factor
VFLEVLTPPLSLVLCGAGADALPLVRIANELGWRVTVADHRPAYANPARFPGADDVIAARPEHLREHLTLDLRTAVVVMTHNYGLDSALLSLLSQTPVAYLGLLGSARREADPEKFARIEETIHAPIGLDLGAATPEEIALSVVAEIKAVTTGRSGASLRTRRVQPSSASEARRAASPGGHRACAIAG